MHTSILFHALKHHRAFIQYFLTTYPDNELPLLGQKLLSIGNSQMDVYTGQMTTGQVAQEIVQQLHQREIKTETAFKEFLLPSHFQTLTLSDTSYWIVRWGEREGQYIHIHPGRYSPHTVRVKATSLKTAIAVLITQRFAPHSLDTEELNQIRTNLLKLSPIKHVADIQGIQKVIEMLDSKDNS